MVIPHFLPHFQILPHFAPLPQQNAKAGKAFSYAVFWTLIFCNLPRGIGSNPFIRTKELQALAWGSFSLSWLLSCLLPCQKQREDYRSGISEEKRPYEGLPQAVRRISICLRFPVALNLALNGVAQDKRAVYSYAALFHTTKCPRTEHRYIVHKNIFWIFFTSYQR